MKTGIIGLPQVGKTSLFKILTKAKLEERGFSNPREAHIGVARVPDERLEKLSALYSPRRPPMPRLNTSTSPPSGRRPSRRPRSSPVCATSMR